MSASSKSKINAKTLSVFSKALDAAAKSYDATIDVITERIYQEVIVPTCEKHGWHFAAGMGGWSFYDPNYKAFEDAKYVVSDELIPAAVLTILSMETIYRSNDIGSLIGKDYPEKKA